MPCRVICVGSGSADDGGLRGQVAAVRGRRENNGQIPVVNDDDDDDDDDDGR